MEKKVSVIIPTYNGIDSLEKCLESVLIQNYDNYEVIVVDDNGKGSENQLLTQKIINKFKNDSRLIYVCHNININGSAARNTGVKNCSGNYITFLDDDDVFLQGRIARQVSLLNSLSLNVGAVYCSHETFLKGEKVGEEHANLSGKILYEYMSHKLEIATSAIMIRKEIFDELNGFDETFARHQDWEFISRLLSRYEIKGDDFYGFKRNLMFRNSRTPPIVIKQRREYYLDKMKPILSNLPSFKSNEIIICEKFDIALAFLKSHDVYGFFKELWAIGMNKILFKLLTSTLKSAIKRRGRYIH